MLYARINDDLSVGGYVEMDNLSSVPKHKTRSDGGLFIRPVVRENMPQDRAELNTIVEIITVEKDRVHIAYSVSKRVKTDVIGYVKNEARNRILARFPEWKQTNMVARGVDLQDIWRRNGLWTSQEQAEADALMQAWDWIKAVRAASDTIEGMETVPDDYDANDRWP